MTASPSARRNNEQNSGASPLTYDFGPPDWSEPSRGSEGVDLYQQPLLGETNDTATGVVKGDSQRQE